MGKIFGRILTDVGSHAHSLMLRIPMRSIVQEYDRAKTQVAKMILELSDSTIVGAPICRRPGYEWQVVLASDGNIPVVQFNEILAATYSWWASNDSGTPHIWQNRESATEKKAMVVEQV